MRDIEKYQKEYVSSDFETEYQVRYRRKKVLEQLDKYPHDAVLEVGCGLEPLFKYIDDFRKWVIVEPSSEFVSNAREKAKNDSRITVFENYFENSVDKINNIHFDMIVISSLLHEVEDPEKIISSAIELSSEKTILHINVPNANSFHRILAKEAGIIQNIKEKSKRNNDLMQTTIFDMEKLKDTISLTTERCKKRVRFIDSGGYFVKPFSHEQMEKCIKCGILDSNVIDAFYSMIKYIPDMGSEIFMDFVVE